ncbi:ATP-dependent Clp protease proteolytic subunit [Synergistes jonesii]|uniref:ATP-dependent Clp protease proteolytic subunit n=1 Tax=Synergistes jonesii TaxID=2754 RepID=A0A073INI2_9BACT|nr:ATP-dependent Clp protease proteolytic subunit [Synergistes jonesii]KEJ91125.1 hypothetical protein EH55_13185 [Synergistes jonesii]
MKRKFSIGAPLFLTPGDDLRNYVEDWLDEPKDVRRAAADDIDGAVVDAGVMTLRLNAYVTANMVQYFHAIENSYNSKIAGRCNEVRISLNTYGGTVADGFEIVDMVREWNARRDVKISMIGAGAVYSMGVPIMQAAARRYSYPNAEYLIHPVSAILYGTREQIEDGLTSVKNSEAAIVNLIAARSGMSAKEVSEMMRRDSYLTAEKALDLGLIDEIINLDDDGGEEDAAQADRRAQEMRALEIYLTEAM